MGTFIIIGALGMRDWGRASTSVQNSREVTNLHMQIRFKSMGIFRRELFKIQIFAQNIVFLAFGRHFRSVWEGSSPSQPAQRAPIFIMETIQLNFVMQTVNKSIVVLFMWEQKLFLCDIESPLPSLRGQNLSVSLAVPIKEF